MEEGGEAWGGQTFTGEAPVDWTRTEDQTPPVDSPLEETILVSMSALFMSADTGENTHDQEWEDRVETRKEGQVKEKEKKKKEVKWKRWRRRFNNRKSTPPSEGSSRFLSSLDKLCTGKEKLKKVNYCKSSQMVMWPVQGLPTWLPNSAYQEQEVK